jgi:hypothetical protein
METIEKSKPVELPSKVEEWGQGVEITKKGVIFTGENPEKLPPSTIIDLIKKCAQTETALAFAQGDLTNFLIGAKGKDLREIADETGIAAGDLKRRAATCQRITYDNRVEQLHFDFHAEAAKSKADDPEQWLKLATDEKLDRKRLKKSIELDRLATDEDLKPVEEENDGGTENFGTNINRIVVLNGKLDRAGNYDEMTVEQLFELHADFMPAVKVWAEIVKRFKDKLPPELAAEFREHLAELAL